MTISPSIPTGRVKPLLALLLALSLLGCGGGGGSDAGTGGSLPGGGTPPSGNPPGGNDPPPGGSAPGGGTDPVDLGIDRSGIIYLSISSFGSVVAGGVRYDVEEASITLNGELASQAALSPGDVAFIVGDINDDAVTGVARSIAVEDLLRGRIDDVDPVAGQFRMLSQTVSVVPDTVFGPGISPRDASGLADGAEVTVRGFVAADGRIVASRIDRTTGSALRVTGFVTAVDPAAFRLTINDLAVSFAAANLEDFSSETPSPGDFVVADALNIEQGVLAATRLASLSGRGREACEDLQESCAGELEGYVSRFSSADDFDVDGFRVVVDDDTTTFEGGSADDLGVDVKLRISGVVADDGRLIASRVTFDDDFRPIGIEAPIQSIDEASSIVRLLGIPVRIDARTRFEDVSEINPSLTDLRVGDNLELVGRELFDDPARVFASRVERESPDDEVALRGFVEAIAAPEFTVLGVTIRTTAETEFEVGDDELSQTAFFAQLQIGELVDIEGTQIGEAIVLADEIEIDD